MTNSIADIMAMLPKGAYDPSEVVLIGSHMDPAPISKTNSKDPSSEDKKARDARRTGRLRVRSDFASTLTLHAHPDSVTDADPSDIDQDPTVALIYAYGFEGHSYRLSKPRIMIVRGKGEAFNARPDFGTLESLTGELFLWRTSKHQQTISIEVESGSVETLILDSNRPGNRSVSAYSAHMQMSHRGGKIS